MRIARPSTFVYYGLLALVLGVGAAVVGARATPHGGWAGLVPVLFLGWQALRQPLRRWRVAQEALPRAHRVWLETHVPFYAALDGGGRSRFERDVQFFLAEHVFEGVDGVEVTDALRLGVAAGAALLLHGRPDWELSASRSILFYPDRFDDDYFGGDYAEYDGMAHPQGPVLFSARAVQESWADPTDGSNVVLHELAHLFDFRNAGDADGIPALIDPASEASWQDLVRKEMRRIRRRRSMLRRYAATAPSEFFAVAVEAFFERPDEMKRRHPELFDALAAFFNLDPRVPVAAR